MSTCRNVTFDDRDAKRPRVSQVTEIHNRQKPTTTQGGKRLCGTGTWRWARKGPRRVPKPPMHAQQSAPCPRSCQSVVSTPIRRSEQDKRALACSKAVQPVRRSSWQEDVSKPPRFDVGGLIVKKIRPSDEAAVIINNCTQTLT